MNLYPGACHCGNVAFRLESDKAPAELGLRTDTCSFCTRQSARYTSDPGGVLHLSFRDPALIARYRFGTRTADFVFCATCGIFVAAVMPDARLGVVNVRTLDARDELLALPLHTADFEGESTEARLARRRARWTPLGP